MKKLLLFIFLSIEICCLGQDQILWTSNINYSWLQGSNWDKNAVPTGTQIAQFADRPTADHVTIGIDQNGYQYVGAIEITPEHSHEISICNSGGNNQNCKLQINGATVNNISHVILRNNSSSLLIFKDNSGSTNSTLGILLDDTLNNFINIDGTGGITINSIIWGTNKNLTKSGTGSGILTFTNAANVYSGTTTITHGELRLNPNPAAAQFASQIILNSGTLSTTDI